jgi:hypothetical protein
LRVDRHGVAGAHLGDFSGKSMKQTPGFSVWATLKAFADDLGGDLRLQDLRAYLVIGRKRFMRARI